MSRGVCEKLSNSSAYFDPVRFKEPEGTQNAGDRMDSGHGGLKQKLLLFSSSKKNLKKNYLFDCVRF